MVFWPGWPWPTCIRNLLNMVCSMALRLREPACAHCQLLISRLKIIRSCCLRSASKQCNDDCIKHQLLSAQANLLIKKDFRDKVFFDIYENHARLNHSRSHCVHEIRVECFVCSTTQVNLM